MVELFNGQALANGDCFANVRFCAVRYGTVRYGLVVEKISTRSVSTICLNVLLELGISVPFCFEFVGLLVVRLFLGCSRVGFAASAWSLHDFEDCKVRVFSNKSQSMYMLNF